MVGFSVIRVGNDLLLCRPVTRRVCVFTILVAVSFLYPVSTCLMWVRCYLGDHRPLTTCFPLFYFWVWSLADPGGGVGDWYIVYAPNAKFSQLFSIAFLRHCWWSVLSLAKYSYLVPLVTLQSMFKSSLHVYGHCQIQPSACEHFERTFLGAVLHIQFDSEMRFCLG